MFVLAQAEKTRIFCDKVEYRDHVDDWDEMTWLRLLRHGGVYYSGTIIGIYEYGVGLITRK